MAIPGRGSSLLPRDASRLRSEDHGHSATSLSWHGTAHRKPVAQRDSPASDPGAACHSGRVAPWARVELVRSSRLASRVPCACAAVAHDGSRLVCTAGACPLDESKAIGDVAGQAERVMTSLRTALHAAGADLPEVVKTTVYVASQHREDLPAAWEVVRQHCGDHDAPSTLLGVAVLGYRDQLVEVETVTALR
jgi:enamine deaminase RidA (YjgF/YER057c/UK114 family)